MLPKKNRLSRKDIGLLFKKGASLSSPNLSLRFIKNTSLTSSGISFIVPKNVVKLATRRNSLRRLAYNIVEKQKRTPPAYFMGAFIFRKYPDNSHVLENEIKSLLDKIN